MSVYGTYIAHQHGTQTALGWSPANGRRHAGVFRSRCDCRKPVRRQTRGSVGCSFGNSLEFLAGRRRASVNRMDLRWAALDHGAGFAGHRASYLRNLPALQTLAAEQFHSRPVVLGLMSSALYVGITVGASAGTDVYLRTGMVGVIVGSACLAAVGHFLGWWLQSRHV